MSRNHLYHSLSPLLLLAAFLVSLLAFLAPTPILHDRVNLLSISTNLTATTSNATLGRRWTHEEPLPALAHRRMVKRSKKSNSTSTSSNSTSTTGATTVKLTYGPLGACYSNSTSSSCLSPSFTPIFIEFYDTLGISSTVQDSLPDQFPLAPTAVFVSLLLLALQLLAGFFSSLASHATVRVWFLSPRQPAMRKVATVAGVLSFAIGMAATLSFLVKFNKLVGKLSSVGATGSTGTGFHQLFAGLALQGVATLLLVAEGFTSR